MILNFVSSGDFVPSHLIIRRHGLPYVPGQGRTFAEVAILSMVGLCHVDAHGTEIIIEEIIIVRVVFVFPGVIVFRHVDLTVVGALGSCRIRR